MTRPPATAFSRYLRERRMTLAELRAGLGDSVAVQTIKSWTSGARIPSTFALDRIADLLRCACDNSDGLTGADVARMIRQRLDATATDIPPDSA